MASDIERDLRLVVSFIKDNSKYDVPKISKDLELLSAQLGEFSKFAQTKLSLRIAGIQDIVALRNALTSMNRTVGKVNADLETFFGIMKKGFGDLKPTAILAVQAEITALAKAFASMNLVAIAREFKNLVKVFQDNAKAIQDAIKPLEGFAGAVDKVERRVNASLQSLQTYSQLMSFISQAATGASGAMGNTKTPVFKSQDSEIANQIGQYDRLVSQIDRAAESVNKFAQARKGSTDRGTEKQVAADARTVRAAYDRQLEVLSVLQTRYAQLTATQGANAQTLASLEARIKSSTESQKRLSQANEAAIAVTKRLENEERERRDNFGEQFGTLGGVIDRQLKFVASASLLAGAYGALKSGADDFLDTQNEVQRILTVSRSDFLSTADTAKRLTETIDEMTVKTGSGIAEVATVLKELGSAGLTTEQSIAALDSTLNNIIGTDSSVVETTRLVASTFSILGNSVTGTADQVANFTRINDVFVRATNESSLEMDSLVQSLKFSITAAKESGLNLEELTGILGQLGDQGLRGGNAGRALRAALQQISKDAPLVAKALNLDIDLTKPLDLLDIIKQYSEQIKGQDITVEELGTVFERFGLRGADVFLLLAQNFDKVEKKIKDFTRNSEGAAAIAANLRLESPERQLDIFQQNVAKLVKTAIEPLVTAFIGGVRAINDFADKARLLGDSTLGKLGLQLLTVTAAFQGLVSLLKFAGIAKLVPGVIAFGTSLAASATAATGLTISLGAVLPVLAAVAAGFIAVAAAVAYFSDNSKTSKDELDKTIVKFQELSAQGDKLSETYTGLAKRILEARESQRKGNITQEEYANELGNIARLSPEAADVIYAYGNNAEVAARKFVELAQVQEEYVRVNKLVIEASKNAKFGIDKKDAADVVSRLSEINKKIEASSAPGVRQTGTLRGQLEIYNKERAAFLQENSQKIAELIRDLSTVAITSNDKNIRAQAKAGAESLKASIGDTVTGIGTSVNKMADIIETANRSIKGFEIDDISTELSQFKNIIDDTTKGLSGAQRDFVFKFGVNVSNADVARMEDQIEAAIGSAAGRQVGENIVNSLNISGLTQIITEDIQKNFTNLGDTKGEVGKALADAMSLGTNDEQVKSIAAFVDSIGEKKKQQLSTDLSIEEREREIASINERTLAYKEHILDLQNRTFRAQDLQVAAAILQAKQDATNAANLKLINLALREARTIRHDILAADANETALASRRLQIFRESSKIQERVRTRNTLNTAQTKKLNEDLETQVGLERDLTQAREKQRKDTYDILRAFRQATISLSHHERIGTAIQDQYSAELETLREQDEHLNFQASIGVNIFQVMTERLKLREREAELDRARLESQTSQLLAMDEARRSLLLLLGGESKRAEIANGMQTTYNDILRLNKDIADAANLGARGEDRYNELLLKRAVKIDEILKRSTELAKIEDKSLERMITMVDLQKKLSDESGKLFEQSRDDLEKPLDSFLGQFFDKDDFSSTLTFMQSIGASFTEIGRYAGNTAEKTEEFKRQLREGSVDLSGYPDKVRELAEAYREANAEVVNMRREQNLLNEQKFSLLEKQFSAAIERGGQEGFDRASSILGELTSLSTIVDETTGRTNAALTRLKLGDVSLLMKELNNIDLNKTPFSGLTDGASLATQQVDLLNEAMSRLKANISSLNDASSDIGGLQKLFQAVGAGDGVTVKDGNISMMNRGGPVPGVGSGDIIPALLEPGEFVIPKRVVREKGLAYFQRMISERYAGGGGVGGMLAGISGLDSGGAGAMSSGLMGAAPGGVGVGILLAKMMGGSEDSQEFIDVFEKNQDALKKNTEILESLNAILAKARDSSAQQPSGPIVPPNSLNQRDAAADAILIQRQAELAKAANQDAKEFLAIYSRIEKVIGAVSAAWGSYTKTVRAAGQESKNFFMQFSAKAAGRLLDQIESIGTKFEELFTKDLPNFLSFFLSDVVMANVAILANYNKVRKDIAKTYKDQRADLIEQLKRNEISYFDFFDKLEDLGAQKNDDELKAEEDKNKAIQEQFSRNAEVIANIMAGLISGIATNFADFAAGFPALISPVTDFLSNSLGGIGGALGGALGGAVGGALGDTIGVVSSIAGAAVGAAGQFFGFVAQGFAQLIPLITRIATMSQEEFEGLVEYIDTFPDMFIANVKKISDRIGPIVDKLVDGGALERIALSFAAAIKLIFPQIATAFVSIVIESLGSIGPIITAMFDVLPDLLAAVFAAGAGIVDLVADIFVGAGEEFLNFFDDNLERVLDVFATGFETLMDNLLTGATDITDVLAGWGDRVQEIPQRLVEGVVARLQQVDGQQIAERVFGLSSGGGGLLDSALSSLNGSTSFDAQGNNPIMTAMLAAKDKFVEAMVAFIRDLPGRLSEGLSKLKGVSEFVKGFLESFKAAISLVLKNLPEDAKKIFAELVNQAPAIAGSIIDALTDAIAGFSTIDGGMFNELIEKVLSGISSDLIPVSRDIVIKLFDAMAVAVTPERVFGLVDAMLGAVSAGFQAGAFGFDLGDLGVLDEVFASIRSLKSEFEKFFGATKELATAIFRLKDKAAFKFFNDLKTAIDRITKSDGFVRLMGLLNNVLDRLSFLAQKITTSLTAELLNTLTALFGRLTDVINEVSSSLDGDQFEVLAESIDILAKYLETTAVALQPVVDELMPYLIEALVLLSVSGLIPLIASLYVLIAVLETVIIVIDSVNFVLGVLSPLFAMLEQVLGPIEPVLRVIATVLMVAFLASLLLLLGPLGLLVLAMIALGVAIAAVKAAVEELTPVVAIFANIMTNVVNDIRNGAATAVGAFRLFIVDLIDSIPGGQQAREAGEGWISQGRDAIANSGLPGFASGGLVLGEAGRRGTDEVAAYLTHGEYVITKDAVRNLGVGFLDSLNTGSSTAAPQVLGSNLSTSASVLGSSSSMSSAASGSGYMPAGEFENANTRDFYLRNYFSNYSEDMQNMAMSSTAESDSQSSGWSTSGTSGGMLVAPPPSLVATPAGGQGSSGDSPTIIQKVEVRIEIDMRGSTFNGDDLGEELEKQLVEKMNNNSSELSRKITEAIENGTRRQR